MGKSPSQLRTAGARRLSHLLQCGVRHHPEQRLARGGHAMSGAWRMQAGRKDGSARSICFRLRRYDLRPASRWQLPAHARAISYGAPSGVPQRRPVLHPGGSLALSHTACRTGLAYASDRSVRVAPVQQRGAEPLGSVIDSVCLVSFPLATTCLTTWVQGASACSRDSRTSRAFVCNRHGSRGLWLQRSPTSK